MRLRTVPPAVSPKALAFSPSFWAHSRKRETNTEDGYSPGFSGQYNSSSRRWLRREAGGADSPVRGREAQGAGPRLDARSAMGRSLTTPVAPPTACIAPPTTRLVANHAVGGCCATSHAGPRLNAPLQILYGREGGRVEGGSTIGDAPPTTPMAGWSYGVLCIIHMNHRPRTVDHRP